MIVPLSGAGRRIPSLDPPWLLAPCHGLSSSAHRKTGDCLGRNRKYKGVKTRHGSDIGAQEGARGSQQSSSVLRDLPWLLVHWITRQLLCCGFALPETTSLLSVESTQKTRKTLSEGFDEWHSAKEDSVNCTLITASLSSTFYSVTWYSAKKLTVTAPGDGDRACAECPPIDIRQRPTLCRVSVVVILGKGASSGPLYHFLCRVYYVALGKRITSEPFCHFLCRVH
jgi:hypothetical protein